MKRDMDLMRTILFFVEDNYVPRDFAGCDVVIDGVDTHVIREHCNLLIEDGLLNNLNSKTAKYLTMSHNGVCVGNLTNKGYDLLDMIRQDTTWNKTKDIILKKGLPLIPKTIEAIASTIIKSATEGAVTAYLKQRN